VLNALGVLIVLVLIFVLVWMPVYQWKSEQLDRYEELNDLVAWIHAKAPAVSGKRGGTKKLPRGQSLRAVIARDAQRANIVIQRTEPKGEDLRVWVNEANFESLMAWLVALQNRFGVETLDAAIEYKPSQKGMVKATLVFRGSSA
jgi:general secretion pathway protein M